MDDNGNDVDDDDDGDDDDDPCLAGHSVIARVPWTARGKFTAVGAIFPHMWAT